MHEGAVFFRPRAIDDWAHATRARCRHASSRRTSPSPSARFAGGAVRSELLLQRRGDQYDRARVHPRLRSLSTAPRGSSGTSIPRDTALSTGTTTWRRAAPRSRWKVRNDETAQAQSRSEFGMEAGDVDFGPYGFGTNAHAGRVRTIRGTELPLAPGARRTYTLRDEPPPQSGALSRPTRSGSPRCVKDYWVSICLPAGRAVDGEADYDFWYVGVHDARR